MKIFDCEWVRRAENAFKECQEQARKIDRLLKENCTNEENADGQVIHYRLVIINNPFFAIYRTTENF